jgi:DNA-binding transcriptional ArsR family regulator
MVSYNLPLVVAYEQNAIQALGDPTRFAIFEQLLQGPATVGELARGRPVSRPAVSQHLAVLKHAGLVRGDKRGTRIYYRIRPETVAQMRDYFDRYWKAALESFKAALEKEMEGES